MGSQVVSFLRPNRRSSDWTREELAELYRIEHALLQARLTVDTDHGISDEGDPWFVFCRWDGEVLVHISRIGVEYYLHSPGLPHPLVGRSFTALTKSFVNQIPVQLPLGGGQGAQGAKLYVHPAAMLAVIIGTIFVASEDTHIFSQNTDAESQSDKSSDVSDRSLKTSFQTAFQSYVDFFLGSLRDWNANQDSSYLTLISTLAAIFLGSSTVANLDQAASIAELAGGIDASTTDGVAVTSFSTDVTTVNSSGERLATAQVAFGINVPQDGETSPVPPEQANSQAVHLVLNSSIAQLDVSLTSKTAGEAVSTKGISGPTEADSIDLLKGLQDFAVASLEPLQNARALSIGQSGNTGSPSDSVKGSGAPAATQSAPSSSNSSLDASANGTFDGFVHTLKLDFSAAVLAPNDPTISGALLNAMLLVPNESHPLSTSTELPAAGSGGNAVASSAQSVSASTPTTPSDAGSGANAAAHADQSVNTSNHVPLFDAAAAATISAFLRANPTAEIIYDHANVIIYDGHSNLDSLRPMTMQVWESENGAAIAIVGHADHGFIV